MNPIVTAVEPLRVDAVKRANIEALTILNNVNTMLVNGGWDVDSLAPYPHGKIDRQEYDKTLGTYILSRKLLKLKDAPVSEMSQFISGFIKDAENNADHQYNIFVKELQTKIGEYSESEFKGNHVTSISTLKLNKPEDKTTYWKNEMVSGLSKNGKHACDFVIKKMKAKEIEEM